MVAKQLIITGRVQGVGYRDWLVVTARNLGLIGWVRNLLDCSVEAQIAGEAQAVEDCTRACWQGPAFADVETIADTPCDPPEQPGFIKRSTA